MFMFAIFMEYQRIPIEIDTAIFLLREPSICFMTGDLQVFNLGFNRKYQHNDRAEDRKKFP